MKTPSKSEIRLLRSLHARLVSIDGKLQGARPRGPGAAGLGRPAERRPLRFAPVPPSGPAGCLKFTSPPQDPAWFLPALPAEAGDDWSGSAPDSGFRLTEDMRLSI